MREVEGGVLEERGVAGEELSSVEEVRQMALEEPLYLISVLPKLTGSSGDFRGSSVDFGGVLAAEEGGGGEDGWKVAIACSRRSSWSMV